MSDINNDKMDMDQFMEDFLNFGMEESGSMHSDYSCRAGQDPTRLQRQGTEESSANRHSMRRNSNCGDKKNCKHRGSKKQPMNPQKVLRMIEKYASLDASDKASAYLHYDGHKSKGTSRCNQCQG